MAQHAPITPAPVNSRRSRQAQTMRRWIRGRHSYMRNPSAAGIVTELLHARNGMLQTLSNGTLDMPYTRDLPLSHHHSGMWNTERTSVACRTSTTVRNQAAAASSATHPGGPLALRYGVPERQLRKRGQSVANVPRAIPGHPVHLGEVVRDARDRARLSQRAVAERSGVSLRTLREIESGRVRMPRLRSIERLAETLQDSRLLEHGATGASGDDIAYGHDDHLILRVLGPLSATRGHSVLNAGTPMQQSLLGLLALHANRSVSQEEMAHVLWGEEPPNSFHQLIHTYVSRLRALLTAHQDPETGTPSIVRRNAGYELRIEAECLDLLQFRELTRRAEYARLSGDLTLEVQLLRDSLQMWSGLVLEGFSPRLREHPLAMECGQQQISSALRFSYLAVTSGHYEQAIDQLRPIVRHHPLHEGLHARLMIALAGAGQQVEALALFSRLDRALRNDFGIEPGAELRAAQMAVLRGVAPVENSAPAADHTAGRKVERPYELPPDTHDLVGRAEHHPVLLHLTQGGSHTGLFGPSPVAAMYGPPGAGKSVLAVRVANSSRLHYVDGILYADIRNETSGATQTSAILERFLRVLGTPERGIPKGLTERISCYRSLLAERRVLVVVDNVAREEQIAPLLPGGFSSALLFSSRTPLVGIPGARHFPLSLFTTEQAFRLLARIVGEDRAHAEPDRVAEIAELCGHLPLAIRIVGRRLAARPHWSLARMAQRLRNEEGRLSELAHGDLDVRSRLDTHVASLEEPLRQTLMLLTDCAGPFTVDTAADALGCSPAAAEDLIDSLVDHQLLTGPDATGRYELPVLTRLHARTRA
ncbi:BTAD domain-containing putative transcriptional regulator [Streptomyces sp. NPDC005970]|uniref:BTAD domain-containing putative transcriptional regulator n=1 Tax=Streptomyces sp. NPDC005970 TaxID=3156723 RepID=UPI0033D3D482